LIAAPPLPVREIEEGYRAAAALYPWNPSMILWRGWEYAAYRRFELPEPVLDVGCGDGRFFRAVFPNCTDVVGVELDEAVAAAAKASGVYRAVHRIAADALPASTERFASAFANCSLEHMDHLAAVLRGIHDSLRPKAPLLCSVVTDRFTTWSPLPLVLEAAGAASIGREVQRGHEAYHHLVNALSRDGWRAAFQQAGFVVEDEMPIVPEMTARLFLFADQFVHLQSDDAEQGGRLSAYLQQFPSFHAGFERVLSGVLAMEANWQEGIGLVLWLRKAS